MQSQTSFIEHMLYIRREIARHESERDQDYEMTGSYHDDERCYDWQVVVSQLSVEERREWDEYEAGERQEREPAVVSYIEDYGYESDIDDADDPGMRLPRQEQEESVSDGDDEEESEQ